MFTQHMTHVSPQVEKETRITPANKVDQHSFRKLYHLDIIII